MRPTQRWTVVLLMAAACGSTEPSPPPALPAGAVALTPALAYAAWWKETEECSGLTGTADQYRSIRWFVVPGAETFDAGGGHQVTGSWERAGGETMIVLAGNYANHEMAVRHEMLHELIGRAGHPAEYFQERCHLTWETWTG